MMAPKKIRSFLRVAAVAASLAGAALVTTSAFAQEHGQEHAHAATRLTAPAPTGPSEGDHVDETGTGNAEAEHEDEHAGPKPINFSDTSNKKQPPYIAALLNFVVLAGIYWYFGKGPVAKGLQERRDTIQKQIEEAQRMKEEAQERAKEYQAKLSNLETELAETKQALVEAGKHERDRIVHEAEEKAARMTKDAQFLIEQEMKTMREQLRRQTVEIAVAAAENLLKQRLTGDDQSRLADEYLAELTAKASKAKTGTVGGVS